MGPGHSTANKAEFSGGRSDPDIERDNARNIHPCMYALIVLKMGERSTLTPPPVHDMYYVAFLLLVDGGFVVLYEVRSI